MTSLGIEPATFRLVTQCLNQLRYRVPLTVLENYEGFPSATNFMFYEN
jgi:hypothetical protein